MLESSSRLKFSFNTLHLGILFLDHYLASYTVSDEQLYVYAATALMLACTCTSLATTRPLAKAIELDMKIPFISKLKRYTGLENATAEFKRAEANLLKHLNWYRCVPPTMVGTCSAARSSTTWRP